MLLSYAVLILLYFLPVAAWYIGTSVSEDPATLDFLKRMGVTSPMMAAFWVPLDANILSSQDPAVVSGDWGLVILYFGFTLLLIALMFAIVAALLRNRWGMTRSLAAPAACQIATPRPRFDRASRHCNSKVATSGKWSLVSSSSRGMVSRWSQWAWPSDWPRTTKSARIWSCLKTQSRPGPSATRLD